MKLLLVVCVFSPIVLGTGCARRDFRLSADRDAYGLLNSRQFDPRWVIPKRAVEPNPASRLADINDVDCPPLPPDDPAAAFYMRHPFNSRPVSYWDKRGQTDAVDSLIWQSQLPVDEDGVLQLSKQRCIDMGLLHSRDFQDQVEQLHLAAMGLSLSRFEFEVNWAGGSGLGFSTSGGDGQRTLSENNQLGFSRNFAAGGQFATNLANAFVWQFGGGGDANFASGNLIMSLTQPLLRGAFRHVRTESLTSAERSLLYSVRNFARFRRAFYLGIVADYFSLLNQVESLRIERDNLKNLRLSLEEHDELYARELVTQIQVDTLFQSYQVARLGLINSEQQLEASLDQFKFTLGLPARVKIELDESILEQFQLNSPELVKLQEDALELGNSLMQYLPPSPSDMEAGKKYDVPDEFYEQAYETHEKFTKKVLELRPRIVAELEKLQAKLKDTEPDENTSEDTRIDHEQQTSLAERIEGFLGDMEKELEEMQKAVKLAKEELAKPIEGENQLEQKRARWEQLQFLITAPRQLQFAISNLFVAQTQIRLFLIEFDPLDVEPERAVEIALENRLDLMNSRAQVVDSYRGVEIAANALKSDLSVSASANLNTDSNRRNPFRFDGEESTYNLGLQFDGPLNRMGERNGFRASQIAYQQQRRAYMATEDTIINQIRQDLRSLTTDRLNFVISRQRLIAATRQVDEAQFNLRFSGGDSSLTQDLLNALQGLQGARNGLIGSWVSYEISRIRLFVDLELLNLDDNGNWINEREKDIFGTGSDPSGSAELIESTVDEPNESNGLISEPDESDGPAIDSLDDAQRPGLEPESGIQPPSPDDPDGYFELADPPSPGGG